MEEPGEPPRPSVFSRAVTRFQEGVWPKISWLFTFKIERDGHVGTFLRVFGCIAAFLSCFTITYQVNSHSPAYPYLSLTEYLMMPSFCPCRLRSRTTRLHCGWQTMCLSSISLLRLAEESTAIYISECSLLIDISQVPSHIQGQ